ncbi:MAG: DUF3552 domain-containing protein, partial [Deltaproteobacteria bacterium]|nr:DUF3552 domain-containing protein [Deltaproteobacteria bacterium]
MLFGAVIATVVGAVVGVWVAATRSSGDASAQLEAARLRAKSLVQRASREAQAAKTKLVTEARERALAERANAEAKLSKREGELGKREAKLAERVDEVDELVAAVASRDDELNERHQRIQASRDRHRGLRKNAQERLGQMRALLEERAGVEGSKLAERLGQSWIEKAQASAAHRVRAIEQSASDSYWSREAERMLMISSGRYENHFLTERLISNIKVADGVADILTSEDERILRALEEVSNVKLNVSETGEAVRLEGLDGVG